MLRAGQDVGCKGVGGAEWHSAESISWHFSEWDVEAFGRGGIGVIFAHLQATLYWRVLMVTLATCLAWTFGT